MAQELSSQQRKSLGSGQALFGALTGSVAIMLPDVFSAKARRDIWRCGFLNPTAYENYLALRNFLFFAVVFSTVCWFFAFADNPTWTKYVLISGLILAIASYSLPRVFFSMLGEARAKRIVAALPDGLDLLAMAMSGGLPFYRALEHTIDQLKEAHPDLAAEFMLIGRQSGAGSLEISLKRFAERIDMPESTSVVESLAQAVQLGSPIRLILESLADRMRKDRMLRVSERANKNAIKMLFPTVLCLAPAALIIVMLPPLLKLREFRAKEYRQGGALSKPATIGGVAPNRPGNATPPANASSR
jgi:tight adherence protein C